MNATKVLRAVSISFTPKNAYGWKPRTEEIIRVDVKNEIQLKKLEDVGAIHGVIQ